MGFGITMAKAKSNGTRKTLKELSLEQVLWNCRVVLRNKCNKPNNRDAVLAFIFLKFVESHHGNKSEVSVYGQESDPDTYRLAKMNLAIRGISNNLGERNASSFLDDRHKDLKVDFIMANPPFNLKNWRNANQLTSDPRWAGYGVPPVSNANYLME